MPSKDYKKIGIFQKINGGLWNTVKGIISGFDERAFHSNPGSSHAYRWSDYRVRRLRYSVLWGFYESNVYSKFHSWSSTMKDAKDLPTSIREIGSPAYRIGEFWATHIWGGAIDIEAGDGSSVTSALPIIIPKGAPKEKELRSAISKIWKDSNFQSKKDTIPRFGAVLGDVCLCVDDNRKNERVTIRIVNPSSVVSMDRDSLGNIKGYVIEEIVPDPRYTEFDSIHTGPTVVKREVCVRNDEGLVEFSTYLDSELFDWTMSDGENYPEWTENYGFVPMVWIQNKDIGAGFGWSEYQSSLSKFLEMDSLATGGCNSAYRSMNAPHLFVGMRGPKDISIDDPEATDEDERPDAHRFPAIYTMNPEAKAMPLYQGIDSTKVLSLMASIEEKIISEHPELRADAGDRGASLSGEAISKAREKVEREVRSRRSSYDDGLKRTIQMAISIGAINEYPGYEDFSEASFRNGEIDFSIGDRPVFAVDMEQKRKADAARATILQTLRSSGIPIISAMEIAGYTKDQIYMVESEVEKEAILSSVQDQRGFDEGSDSDVVSDPYPTPSDLNDAQSAIHRVKSKTDTKSSELLKEASK
jgi:hypothetical protein